MRILCAVFALIFLFSPAHGDTRRSTDQHANAVTCAASLAAEFGSPPDDTDRGLVTSTVDLTVPSLLAAYAKGIFPWGLTSTGTGEWYNPPRRGVLVLNEVEIPRSDLKFIRKHLYSGEYVITDDADFAGVIRRCAEQDRYVIHRETGRRIASPRWLTERFINSYTDLHKAGHAHSMEAWRDGRLVAGLYGVFVNGVYSGESMFHDRQHGSNANKLLFYVLIDRLRRNGHSFIDTQQVIGADGRAIGLAGKWGARYISREEYLERLSSAQALRRPYR